MTTPNAVRRRQIDELVGAFGRMSDVSEAAKKLREELKRKKEEEEAG